MKELMCLAVFVGKVFCLTVFIAALKPETISAVQGSTEPIYCNVRCSPVQGSGQLSVFAAATQADAEPCDARPSVAAC